MSFQGDVLSALQPFGCAILRYQNGFRGLNQVRCFIMKNLHSAVAMVTWAGLFLAAGGPAAVFAATGTWTGTTSNDWATTTNWAGGVVPGATSGTANQDVALFDSNPSNRAPTWSTYLNLSGFTFDTGAGGYTIGTTSGSSVSLTNGGTTQLTAGVTVAQVINAPLLMPNSTSGTAYTFLNSATTAAATLTLNGAISGQNTTGTALIAISSSTAAITIGGVISNGTAGGRLGLVKNGPGLLTLSASNSFSGNSLLNTGTLAIGDDYAVGSAGQWNYANATIRSTDTTPRIIRTATVALGTGGSTTVFGSAETGNLLFTGILNVGNNGGRTLAINNATTEFQGPVIAATSVIKTGTGTLIFSGPNTYSGLMTVRSGALRFNSVASGTNAQALGTNAAVNLGLAGTSAGEIDYFGAGGTLDKNVAAVGSGRNRIRNSGGGTLTLSGTLTKNGTILELAQGAFVVSGRITGANANSDLFVNGGTVTLTNGDNDYNGPTYVYGGGTLALGASGVIPNGSSLTLGGTGSDTGIATLATGTFSETFASLTTSALGGTVSVSGSGGTLGSLTTTGNLTFGAGTDTLALSLSDLTLGRYTVMTYQGTRSGTFDSVTGNGNYTVVYGAASNSTIDLQLRANQAASFTLTPAATNVLVGGSTTLTGSIVNTSPVDAAALGIDLASTGGLAASGFGSSSGFTLLAGGTSTITAALAAGATPGVQSWSITNTDASAITTVGTASGSLTVFDPALASFASGSTSTSLLVDLGSFSFNSGMHSAGFSIFNLLSDPTYTADLALLTIIDGTSNSAALSTNLSPFAALAAGSSNSWLATISTDAAGSFQNTYTLNFASAKDGTALGGPQSMSLTVQGIVVVPEPGALALAGIGMMMAGWSLATRRGLISRHRP